MASGKHLGGDALHWQRNRSVGGSGAQDESHYAVGTQPAPPVHGAHFPVLLSHFALVYFLQAVLQLPAVVVQAGSVAGSHEPHTPVSKSHFA